MSFCLNLDLHTILAESSALAHKTCIQLVQSEQNYGFILQAITCGKAFYQHESYQSLQQLGLIHLFVVSGLHLSLIESLLLRRKPSRLRLLLYSTVCFCYALACNWKPPVVRALSFSLVRQLNSKQKLNWSSQSCQLAANLMLLLLFPQWWASLSLALSWGCSLIFSLPYRMPFKLVLIFILLSGLFQPWIQLSPLTILTSLVLSPVILFVGFPLLFLAQLSVARPLSDIFWESCFFLFSHLQAFMQNPVVFEAKWSIQTVIIIIFIANITIIKLEVLVWRKKLHS